MCVNLILVREFVLFLRLLHLDELVDDAVG